MKRILTNIFSVALFASGVTVANAQTFSYTGSLQNITVPPCADSVTITAIGGGGGKGPYNAPGKGASIKGTFAVNPGTILDIV
ncbi:MAG TPA: hypothetical protein VNZ45_10190, partial [Bacteroidia bacterium]|nr:hypothetical protein [Bacteroidia bacterium]